MDRILNYLPDNVHVRFGWEKPSYRSEPINLEYRTIVMPKQWLKHNKRGVWNEFEIKKEFKKKLMEYHGEEFIHTTEPLVVYEWNQIENICSVLKRAKEIGFDNILDIVNNVNPKDVIYDHAIY